MSNPSILLPNPPAPHGETPEFICQFPGDAKKIGGRYAIPGPIDTPDTLGNILQIYNTHVRLNARNHRAEINQGTGWMHLSDENRKRLQLALTRDFCVATTPTGKAKAKAQTWNLSDKKLAEWLFMLATDDTRDDVKDFFLSLKNQWDKTERLKFVLAEQLGAEFNELNQWASTYLFVGTVLATLHPGKRRRGVVTLVGPQYSGKTTLLLSLLPQGLQHYCTSISLHGDDKQRTESLLGMGIVELGELAGATRTESEQLKSWLTRDADYVRLSYRRDPQLIPRQTLITASINTGQELPRDPSGSTRWITVQCPLSCNVELEITDEMRLQWWAEAMHIAHAQGPSLTPSLKFKEAYEKGIPHHLLPEQAAANAPHEARDETAQNALDAADFQTGHFATLVQLAQDTGWLPRIDRDGVTPLTKFQNKKDANEFAAEIRLAGWQATVKRIDGKSVRGWTKM